MFPAQVTLASGPQLAGWLAEVARTLCSVISLMDTAAMAVQGKAAFIFCCIA